MNRIKNTFLIFFGVYSLCTVATGAGTDKPALWKPDLNSDQGIYRFLRELSVLYPTLGTEKFGYQVNIANLYKELPALLKKLGKDATALEISDALHLTLEYRGDGKDWAVDTKRMENEKLALLNELSTLPLDKFTNLKDDLKKIGQKNEGKLFPLIPFLYNSDGSAKHNELSAKTLTAIKKEFNALTPVEVSEKYFYPLTKNYMGTIAQSYESAFGLKKEEWKKKLETRANSSRLSQAVRPINEDGSSGEKQILSVQEVHPLAALIRSYWVRDCSAQTAASYPLGKGVKAWALRLKNNVASSPSGYFLTYEGTHEGKPAIYALGGMGFDLNSKDYNNVVRMVAEAKGAKVILVPNVERGYQPNPERIWDGLVFDGQKETTFKAPDYWTTIDEHINKSKEFDLDVYLEKAVVENAKVANVPKRPGSWGPMRQEHFAWEVPHTSEAATERLSAAALAADVLEKIPYRPGISKPILEGFGIDAKDLNAVQRVKAAVKGAQPPSLEDVHEFKAAFGDLKNMRRFMDPNLWLETMVETHTKAPNLVSDKEWTELFKSAEAPVQQDLKKFQQTNEEPENRTKRGNYANHTSQLLLSVPQKYSSINVIEDEGLRAKATSSNILTRAKAFTELHHALLRQGWGQDQYNRRVSILELSTPALPKVQFKSPQDAEAFILRLVGVSREQLNAANQLEQMRANNSSLDVDHFNELLKELGIEEKEFIKDLQPDLAIDYYSRLHEEQPEAHTPREWREIFTKVQRRLKLALRDEVARGERNTEFDPVMFRIPEEYALISYGKAVNAESQEYFSDLIAHLKDRESWDKRLWKGVVNLLKSDFIDNSQKDSILKQADTRFWSGDMYDYAAELLRSLPEEQHLDQFKKYYKTSPERKIIEALNQDQAQWTRAVWQALVDKIPTLTDPELRKTYLELAVSHSSWPKDFHESLSRILANERDPEMRKNIKRCERNPFSVGIAEVVTCRRSLQRIEAAKEVNP